MIRKKSIAIFAIICLLFPITLLAKGSMLITTTVPNKHVVSVVAGMNGIYIVNEKEYKGNYTFRIDRFADFMIDVVPNDGYTAAIVCEEGSTVSDNNVLLSRITADTTVKINFISDNSDELLVIPPSDCVVSCGKNKILEATAYGNAPLKYRWDVSLDGGGTWEMVSDYRKSSTYEIIKAEKNPNGENKAYQYRVTVMDAKKNTETAITEVLVTDEYLYRTIAHEYERVYVSTIMHNGTELVVTYLDKGNDEVEDMVANLDDSTLPLIICDVSLVNQDGEVIPYFGEIALKFYVGDVYNGQTLRVLHKHEEGMMIHTGLVDDGYLTIVADSLSPFMIEVPRESVYKVMAIAKSHGKIVPEGEIYVGCDSDVAFMFQPDRGYLVEECLVNGVPIQLNEDGFTIKKIKADSIIQVSFAKDKAYFANWIVLILCILVMLHLPVFFVRRARNNRKEKESQ